jgi:hypothetical protein
VDTFDLAIVFYFMEFFKSTGMEGLMNCNLPARPSDLELSYV